MKRSFNLRALLSLLLVLSMLSPVAVLAAGKGDKHFKLGMKYESSEDWDKASEEFALALTENPKNPEFRLHLARALFNASQQYIKRGTLAAKEKDYEGGYLAFRKAYAFDPTNELAKSEMERMVRLQQDVDKTKPGAKPGDPNVKLVPTAYNGKPAVLPQVPQKLEKFRDLPFPNGVDLQFIIKELARDLDLNVLFDIESFRTTGRKTNIELRNVTAARVLDYIFLQEGLFFQKVGPRTIMVASQAQRMKFQQLVLRTFYLANAAPKDIAKVVQTAIPAQPGRSQTIVLTDDATNSVTIRDTEENIRLIGQLIQSLDKDRAEVVMDVAIYEVNKSDLLQWGNQLGSVGSGGTLLNLGGVGLPPVHAGTFGQGNNPIGFPLSSTAAIAFGLPLSAITALQSRSNTKLIASTQIHAFNNEDSSARIGQRVPVQSAQFVTGAGTTVNNGGVVSNVINYEQVGLTLKFKPLVFPNQDVQVAMEIESKDVAGASTLTPTFTERTIKGTARVQNNKTLLLASVAQGVETNSRSGLPVLGLIPILGRLFTAPVKDHRQVDIVIAVTPRVIRAPAILPEDEIERPTGTVQTPTGNSLEAMIIEEEQSELLAAARKVPNQSNVQLPDQTASEAPDYVRTDSTGTTPTEQKTNDAKTSAVVNKSDETSPMMRPIDSSVKTLKLNETADIVKRDDTAADTKTAESNAPSASVSISAGLPDLKAGERATIQIAIDGGKEFHSAIVGLKFDEKKLAVRSVTMGDVFGSTANAKVIPFLNQSGRMYVAVTAKDGTPAIASGSLITVEIEALADGKPALLFDRDILNVLTSDGRNFVVKVNE